MPLLIMLVGASAEFANHLVFNSIFGKISGKIA